MQVMKQKSTTMVIAQLCHRIPTLPSWKILRFAWHTTVFKCCIVCIVVLHVADTVTESCWWWHEACTDWNSCPSSSWTGHCTFFIRSHFVSEWDLLIIIIVVSSSVQFMLCQLQTRLYRSVKNMTGSVSFKLRGCMAAQQFPTAVQ